jgi:hypothetical protein
MLLHSRAGADFSKTTDPENVSRILAKRSPHSRVFNLSAKQLMKRSSATLLFFCFLGGCATAPPPPLTADSPASPSAPEATVPPLHNALAVDDLTRKTRQIFEESAKEHQGDQSGPASGEQQAQQMQNMPGMNMPQEQTHPSPTPSN